MEQQQSETASSKSVAKKEQGQEAYTAVRVVELSKEAMPWLEAILGIPSVGHVESCL